MKQKVKMIWDMRGMHAKGMAEHHAIHLQEYADKKGITTDLIGTEDLTDMYSMAFMIIAENDSEDVRKILRPHRIEPLD